MAYFLAAIIFATGLILSFFMGYANYMTTTGSGPYNPWGVLVVFSVTAGLVACTHGLKW